MKSTLSDHFMNFINKNEVLGLLKYYLREVAKCQYTLVVLTNNILTSLISQLCNLQILVSNPTSTLANIPSSLPLRSSSLTNTLTPRNLLCYSQLNIPPLLKFSRD